MYSVRSYVATYTVLTYVYMVCISMHAFLCTQKHTYYNNCNTNMSGRLDMHTQIMRANGVYVYQAADHDCLCYICYITLQTP